jgi:hypothetical protein
MYISTMGNNGGLFEVGKHRKGTILWMGALFFLSVCFEVHVHVR